MDAVRFLEHVDCRSLGNSQVVATKHHVHTTDEHFTKATTDCSAAPARHYPAETLGAASQISAQPKRKTPVSQENPTKQGQCGIRKVDDIGLERLRDSKGETAVGPELYASLYAHDPQLARLIECWPRLTDEDRQALTDHAEHLAAGRIEFAK